MDDLYASGSIAEETPDEEANRKRVEELENEILRLRRELGQDVDEPTPGEAAEDLLNKAAEDNNEPEE
jgi:hypothetical protein